MKKPVLFNLQALKPQQSFEFSTIIPVHILQNT